MKIVLVGEAWGVREKSFAHPLVGPSGRELTLEMGRAGLAPFMKLRCRKCKAEVSFIGNFHCPTCNEYLAPSEFDLMRHWKELKLANHIAVTNVFNEQPPSNDLGYFFGTNRETPMAPWKASKKSPGTHLKVEFFFHIKRLWNEIYEYQPNLVICMGNAAVWALTNSPPKISEVRGYVDSSSIPWETI